MSIFKTTFPAFVSSSLEERQNELQNNRENRLNYLNSRNSWIKLSSGVNIIDNQGNSSNNLAKTYQLFGGVLNNNKQRFNIGSNINNSYSNNSYNGENNRLGIKPMPGLESISVQSKTAYGSLKEATIKFYCWDIKQLEDLELLYMRPGYTVLLEYGWNYPGKDIKFFDIFEKKGVDFLNTFKEIYKLVEGSKGDYDFLLGKITNYQWSARSDGGYDCVTTIISYGEVLESIKLNYVPLDSIDFKSGKTFLGSSSPLEKRFEEYNKGILNGLLYEIDRFIINKKDDGKNIYDTKIIISNNFTYNIFKKRWNYSKPDLDGNSYSRYITLGSLCDLINNYILLKNKEGMIVKLSTNDREYGNSDGKSLKCIANPLSIFTNPEICIFKPDMWLKKENKKLIENTNNINTSVKRNEILLKR